MSGTHKRPGDKLAKVLTEADTLFGAIDEEGLYLFRVLWKGREDGKDMVLISAVSGRDEWEGKNEKIPVLTSEVAATRAEAYRLLDVFCYFTDGTFNDPDQLSIFNGLSPDHEEVVAVSEDRLIQLIGELVQTYAKPSD